MTHSANRPPAVTQARVAVRIPESVRPRLTRLARRGAEVCRKHGAMLLAEISTGLEVALLEIAASEQRATSAESRARRAEHDLAEARATIRQMKIDLAERAAEDFECATATRPSHGLIERCR